MSSTKAQGLTIGQLAQSADVHVETIRFYQRRALLPEPTRSFGQIRRYQLADVSRVRFIRSAQRLGFSLSEVAGLLRLEDGTHCAEARDAGARKLTDIRNKQSDLARMESALLLLIERCDTSSGKVHCPLIDTLRAVTDA